MTTTVVVKANHGWPVRVTPVDAKSGKPTGFWIVPKDTEREFHVHSAVDLVIHEVQPDEPEAPDWAT